MTCRVAGRDRERALNNAPHTCCALSCENSRNKNQVGRLEYKQCSRKLVFRRKNVVDRSAAGWGAWGMNPARVVVVVAVRDTHVCVHVYTCVCVRACVMVTFGSRLIVFVHADCYKKHKVCVCVCDGVVWFEVDCCCACTLIYTRSTKCVCVCVCDGDVWFEVDCC